MTDGRATAYSEREREFTFAKIRSLLLNTGHSANLSEIQPTRMWADAQRDGRPDEYRWRRTSAKVR